MSSSILPTDKRQLRACLLCALVKNAAQFRTEGCDNCEDVLKMRGRFNRVNECTSSNYQGMLASCNPPQSWVCKFLRIERFEPGIYALKVYGRLPEDVEDELARRKIEYIPRDGSGEAGLAENY
ncbi:transcription elongation factor spt4 [Entomophthora muscae]|uniref:Transcription elongation factor spt4 n=1 Tax=Entomophthora muscae TaxID=34485 RepID=A0ACC2TTR1_9FUNG|nr:transcription elongation factor spt4 [Entomophthora muscae]